MHTSKVDQRFSFQSVHPAAAGMFDVPALPNPGTLPPSLRIPAPGVERAPGTAKAGSADLDALVSAEQSLGVFQGLRLALMFNAGVALTGLLIWECLAMLAG